jgi:hypothetical protein
MLRAALFPKPALGRCGCLAGIEFGALRRESGLYPQPKRVIDDAQLRDLLDQHF